MPTETSAPKRAHASWPGRPAWRPCDAGASRRGSRSRSRARSYGCHRSESSPARMNTLTPATRGVPSARASKRRVALEEHRHGFHVGVIRGEERVQLRSIAPPPLDKRLDRQIARPNIHSSLLHASLHRRGRTTSLGQFDIQVPARHRAVDLSRADGLSMTKPSSPERRATCDVRRCPRVAHRCPAALSGSRRGRCPRPSCREPPCVCWQSERAQRRSGRRPDRRSSFVHSRITARPRAA